MNPTPQSPANPAPKKALDQGRVPMSVPVQKLVVPDIQGFHLHWMRGEPGRIAQALQAGYTFVDPTEVGVVNTGLADSLDKSGSTDLGSRVSVSSGEDGNRLYLMKIPQQYWEADQATLEARNEQIAATIRGGKDVAANPSGSDNRYIPEPHRKGVADLFTPKNRRS